MGVEGGGGMWIGGGRDVQVDDLAFFVFHCCGGGSEVIGMGYWEFAVGEGGEFENGGGSLCCLDLAYWWFCAKTLIGRA